MTRLLLDTHAFLWWTSSPERLSAVARDAIASASNEVLVSHVSAWEMAIKAGLAKLRLPAPVARFFPDQLARNGFAALPLELRDLTAVEALPQHHRDPFDRLLVAQALRGRLTLVTADPVIERYGVRVLA